MACNCGMLAPVAHAPWGLMTIFFEANKSLLQGPSQRLVASVILSHRLARAAPVVRL
jgi:hypothetical protein